MMRGGFSLLAEVLAGGFDLGGVVIVADFLRFGRAAVDGLQHFKPGECRAGHSECGACLFAGEVAGGWLGALVGKPDVLHAPHGGGAGVCVCVIPAVLHHRQGAAAMPHGTDGSAAVGGELPGGDVVGRHGGGQGCRWGRCLGD